MGEKKVKIVSDFESSIDYFNFQAADNDLPILDIINERFLRNFRVTLSNHLHSLCNVNSSVERLTLGEWLEKDSSQSFMSILGLNAVCSSAYFKFDKDLMNGIVDFLSGGNGRKNNAENLNREITQIDINLVRPIAEMCLRDLEESWKPVHKMDAKYIRTEVNPKFVLFEHGSTKLYSVRYKVEFANFSGSFEIVYPYRALFPLRDILFSARN